MLVTSWFEDIFVEIRPAIRHAASISVAVRSAVVVNFSQGPVYLYEGHQCNQSKAAGIHLEVHHKNFPMQYTEIFLALKIQNFQQKTIDIFLFVALT